jgi:class 3 adenylate cyclase
VSVRDHIDYFGQTVNAAARIQAAAAPGEIVLSDDVFRGVGVADLLLRYDLIAERRKLRGVSTEMLLHRVASAPRGLDEADLRWRTRGDLAAGRLPSRYDHPSRPRMEASGAPQA